MNSFTVCLQAILPVFLIIGAGYLSKRAGIIREEGISKMNAVTFKVFMSVMCFFNIYNSDLSQSMRPMLLIYALIAILVLFGLSCLYAVRFVPDRRDRGVVIQGLYRSNFLIIGLPVAAALVPDADPGVISVLSGVSVPLFNLLAVTVLDFYSGREIKPGKMVLDILKNPLIIGCALGIAALLLGLHFPAPIHTALRDMSRVASPLMLFLLGAFFRFDRVSSKPKELIAVLLGRLIVMPALGLLPAVLLGFRGIELASLMVLFGSSTAVASFTMAQQMGGDGALAGNIVVFTSVGCSFTLFAWSMLFKTLGMF